MATNEKPSLTQELVRAFTSIHYDSLPPEVVAAVKVATLDTLSALLAGTASGTSKKVVALVKDWGGRPESTIFGEDVKVPAANAVLANSTMARVYELDAVLEMLPFHANAIMIPLSLALAEHAGGLSGRDFIVSVAAGIDLAARLGLASKTTALARSPGARSMWGTLSGAATAARIMGLGEEKTFNALGLAYRLGGGGSVLGGHSLDESTWLGWGIDAMGGILAASFARQGLTGAEEAVDEYYLRYEGGEYDRDALLGELGKRFAVTQASLKAWASCRACQASIEGTLEMVSHDQLKPEDVAEITVTLNEISYRVGCLPLDQKKNPRTSLDALFSVPFTVGVALAKGRVTIDSFAWENLNDPVILGISNKVLSRMNPDIKYPSGRPAALVEILMKDGTKYTRQVDYIKGHPVKKPLTHAELLDKFKDCASQAKKPLSHTKIESIVSFIDRLEDAEDVTWLMRQASA
ncbi:MmgE/PrpD family protein [Chloroflexota bacterium]